MTVRIESTPNSRKAQASAASRIHHSAQCTQRDLPTPPPSAIRTGAATTRPPTSSVTRARTTSQVRLPACHNTRMALPPSRRGYRVFVEIPQPERLDASIDVVAVRHQCATSTAVVARARRDLVRRDAPIQPCRACGHGAPVIGLIDPMVMSPTYAFNILRLPLTARIGQRFAACAGRSRSLAAD